MVCLLGSIVSPDRCAACDERLGRRALLCGACAPTVERWDGTGEPWAYGKYGGALASALLRLKYGSRPDLAGPIGLLVRDALLSRCDLPSVDVIVPVPVPMSRLVQRGFNQAALLARPLATALRVPLQARALGRTEGGWKQAALGRQERWQNLAGAYVVRAPRLVEHRRVLLFDDVSTTGATLAGCEQALRQAGALDVWKVVVARAELRGG
ncbi:MAG: ComF family protein [Polyangiaceae bacterium]|jgi:ComF family protein|nr:ComF family protein [Polyangiaceae bacterium]